MTFYVYVAGPLSDTPGGYLANVARISRVSRMLMERGYCPINPAADLIDGLMSDEAMPVEHYQRRSMDLLHLLAGKPAALYVTETHHFDGRQSKGVATEITAAEDLGIPVVYTMSDLMRLKEAW